MHSKEEILIDKQTEKTIGLWIKKRCRKKDEALSAEALRVQAGVSGRPYQHQQLRLHRLHVAIRCTELCHLDQPTRVGSF